MQQRANILLLLTDDQRFDTIAALGNPDMATPNLDALVARGTAFTRAHIPGGTCGAVCMPSRAMLHTGRSLFHLDGQGREVPAAHALLGETFRAHGWQCFGTGKWHNGAAAYARSFDAGAEIFFGGMDDHWNVPACHFDPSGRYDHPVPVIHNPQRERRKRMRIGDHITPGAHSTDLFTDATIDFLRTRDSTRPFFAYVSLMAPHDPRSMPARYLEPYAEQRPPLPPNFCTAHAIDTGALRIRDEMLAGFPRQEDEIREHLAEYYAMITHIDDAFGRLMDELEASGQLANTIIVLAGDNGLAVGQHGLMGKQSVYEHSVRVPLVIAGPGITADARRDELVYLHDLFPTLCEHCALPVPSSVEGRSVAGALHGGPGCGRESLYLAYAESIRGVSDGESKLIEYACGATQLFDLVADPWELDDRASAEPERVAALRERLCAHATAWDDRDHPTGAAFWAARDDLVPQP